MALDEGGLVFSHQATACIGRERKISVKRPDGRPISGGETVTRLSLLPARKDVSIIC
jgi:hypothetical protein